MSENVINTGRLTLRPVSIGDTAEIHKYAGDKSIDMMLFLPNDTMEQTDAFVRNAVLQWTDEKPSAREFVMVYDGRIIGGINLETVDETTYEIGWVVSKDYRNTGFTTEAGKALLEYAFNVLSAEKVIAHCDIRNKASEKVMQKFGMTLKDSNGKRFYEKTGVTSGELMYCIDRQKRRKSE